MTLSIVIVNYNVRHYLDQCLSSVYASALDEFLDGIEVFVVDNNSDDNSVQMVREKYPQATVIANSDNTGFAKANNQAIRLCHGDLVLLLNPDTLVERDTLRHCAAHFAANPQCGGLTVRMYNGQGQYLKESKRGFPSPATSFYKISGLIRLLPHHPTVAAYYMGHLPDDRNAAIDILPGAFLMISREALQKVGLLDESYFMYGEDIDFSWRIRLAGYENHYLASDRILHYKGESTRRSTINYVYTFYNAMSIFARHYYSGKSAHLYSALIQTAIWLRAALAAITRTLRRIALPALDLVAAWGGFMAARTLWTTWRETGADYYPHYYTWAVLPLYALVLTVTVYLCGGHDRPLRIGRSLRGIAVGTCLLLLFYSLLDESLRFSRAIVLIGSAAAAITTSLLRMLTVLAKKPQRRHYTIVGSEQETRRVASLISQLTPKATMESASLSALRDKGPRDRSTVVFCLKDVAVADMLQYITANKGRGFLTAPADATVLVGPEYTHTADDIYLANTTPLPSPTARRSKRLFDIAASLLLLTLSPLLFWPQKRKRRYFPDCLKVLAGRLTWVGYSQPNIRAGIFRTRDRYPAVRDLDTSRLDTAYATDYHTTTDLMILLNNWNRI